MEIQLTLIMCGFRTHWPDSAATSLPGTWAAGPTDTNTATDTSLKSIKSGRAAQKLSIRTAPWRMWSPDICLSCYGQTTCPKSLQLECSQHLLREQAAQPQALGIGRNAEPSKSMNEMRFNIHIASKTTLIFLSFCLVSYIDLDQMQSSQPDPALNLWSFRGVQMQHLVLSDF